MSAVESGSEWRHQLPVLSDAQVTIRELHENDAPSLLMHLADPSVLTYVAGAPQSLAAMRRFIEWCREQRIDGTYVTFAVVPAGQQSAVGLLQIWAIEQDFSTAEWGFVIGGPFRGTGVFSAAATLLLNFAFGTLGVVRLEARAVIEDWRSNRALEKLGATSEGTLRSGFRSGDVVLDHVMWSLLADEWSACQVVQSICCEGAHP